MRGLHLLSVLKSVFTRSLPPLDAVMLFLCGESDTKTSVTVYLVCMFFFISALKFLAKCDLVCVKLKKKC